MLERLRVSRNSVRRYLAGATAGFQERPTARLLDAATLREVHDLFSTVAEGNTVVIQQELARRGLHFDLRTLQRAVGPLRQEQRAEALATVRFETPPGLQVQIDFGEKVVRIAGQPVKVYLMTAVLGYSRRLFCQAFLAHAKTIGLKGSMAPSDISAASPSRSSATTPRLWSRPTIASLAMWSSIPASRPSAGIGD